MAPKKMDPGSRVRVDEESVLARFADWHARTKGRPVAALGPETQEAMLFVADEAIIDGDDRELAEELRARYGAEVLPEVPLPPRPSELGRQERFNLEAMPRILRLRFAAPPRVDGAAGLLERAVAESRRGPEDISVTSELGAAVAAVVARHALEGRSIGLNQIGRPLAMPLSAAQEGAVPGAGSNPFSWQAFAGKTRMVDAWQLVDSIRQLRGNRFTTVAILDSGFWLDGTGVPVVPPGQAVSDFGGGIVQFNLQNEALPAGGASSNGAGPWHGNGVASAAAAAVNNAVGAAGSGGTVAFPLFFQTDISIDQILRCVQICAAWGIDVLNMSIGTWGQTELFFPTSSWDKTFQFAFDNGVVMIAAAGNSTLNLPDDENVRPATRTPGVLTVGALDANDNAAGFSNYGSSVWLWAPGTSVPVAPDPANLAGSRKNGTSLAAPIVAGVAAMMRFANSNLSAADIRRLLIETGWNGTGRVSKGLDAFAAVFAAIHETLPDMDEPNNTPASARDLIPTGIGGALAPSFSGFTARSTKGDRDYWKFSVDKFSTVTVAVDWYQRLSTLPVAVEAEDTEARGPDEMTRTAQADRVVLAGFLPPGNYRIRVGGAGATAYRLLVTRRPSSLPKDIFEKNDSFEKAADLLFEATKWTLYQLRTWGPGTYDATLHQEPGASIFVDGSVRMVMNDDYFRLKVPASSVFARPTVSVYDADLPLDVTLYDNARSVINVWNGVRHMTAHPPENTACFLKVSGKTPTRYRIFTGMRADPTAVPGPLQEELEIMPKWWGDPGPIEIRERIKHYVVEVNVNRGDGEALAFEPPSEPVRIELLNPSGEVVREAEAADGKLSIDTHGIERGSYVLRVSRAGNAGRSTVQLRTAPPLS